MGTSLDKYYPQGHEKIQKFIANEGGLVISHCPPCDHNFKWNFLVRNRLMSAFSDAIVIIEERDNGGAIKNGRNFAIENKRKSLFLLIYLLKDDSISWPKKLKEKDFIYSVRFPGNLVNNILGKQKETKKKEEN